tara:strand:- start:2146 stop:4533 length:2388 start_codon:yes stop_codon:yes gene_type:complete
VSLEAEVRALVAAQQDLTEAIRSNYGLRDRDGDGRIDTDDASLYPTAPPSSPTRVDVRIRRKIDDMLDAIVPDAALNTMNATFSVLDRGMLQYMNELQDHLGGMAGTRAFREGRTLASRYSQEILQLNRALKGTADISIDGLNISLQDMLGDTEEVAKFFDELRAGSTGSADGLIALRTATHDTMGEMAMFGGQLDLSTEETATFVSRAIDLQNEANTSLLREAAVMSSRAAQVTGDSGQEILDIVEKITRDTERYGNVSATEAARIGASLRELGLSYTELDGMVDQFFDFESAAQSVSALTSVFGVQIDAMEAMRMANSPDRLQFLHYIREQFLATAKSVDDMSLAELRLIQQQTGLGSVSAVRRLLDPTKEISSIEELEAATSGGIGSVQENMEELQDSLRNFGRTSERSMQEIRDIMYNALVADMQETLLTATTQWETYFQGIANLAETNIGDVMEMPAIANAGEAIDDLVVQFGNFEREIIGGITAGINLLTEELRTLINNLLEGTRAEQNSPSELGLEMLGGFTQAMALLPEAVKGDFERMVDLSADEIKTLLPTIQGEAREFAESIGRLGIEYTDLTDREIRHWAEELGFQLQETAEGPESDQLASVMSTFANRRAIETRDVSDQIQAVLNQHRGSSEELRESTLRALSEEHEVDVDILREAMINTDAESRNAIFNALTERRRESRAEAEEANGTVADLSDAQRRQIELQGQIRDLLRQEGVDNRTLERLIEQVRDRLPADGLDMNITFNTDGAIEIDGNEVGQVLFSKLINGEIVAPDGTNIRLVFTE